MFEEKEERKKTFWNLGYWKQWMISDQVWRMGRGFPQTQHNGNISTNYQPWCQKLKKFNGRTHHPTWPPPPPPPPLIWAEGTHILVPRALGPRYQTILFHLITPHVSIVSLQFPRLEAFQNTCLITLVSIYIYIFSFRLQKCQSLFLVSRYRL